MRETDAEFGEAHDRYLAGYHTGTEVVWCSNKKCAYHKDGIEVGWESEYGQSWRDVEECPLCGGEWLADRPDDDEDEEGEEGEDDAV